MTKVVILAGGFGTRLAEYTSKIPKPMVPIGGIPILHHIINIYSSHGFTDFTIALGYKSDVIKSYFLDRSKFLFDFSVSLSSGDLTNHLTRDLYNIDVRLSDTGLHTMTGGRLIALRPQLNSTFMLTYGDGLSNVDISKLLSFHKSHGKICTITAVRPPARFGELVLDDQQTVIAFDEKPQMSSGWINGGFMVLEPEFLDFISDSSMMLEREPFQKLASLGQLVAFKHEGFWQCMDTKRDLDTLERLWSSEGRCPWLF